MTCSCPLLPGAPCYCPDLAVSPESADEGRGGRIVYDRYESANDGSGVAGWLCLECNRVVLNRRDHDASTHPATSPARPAESAPSGGLVPNSADDVLLESAEGAPVPLLSGLPSDLKGRADFSPGAAVGASFLNQSVDAEVEESPFSVKVNEAGEGVIVHVSSVLDAPTSCQDTLTDEFAPGAPSGEGLSERARQAVYAELVEDGLLCDCDDYETVHISHARLRAYADALAASRPSPEPVSDDGLAGRVRALVESWRNESMSRVGGDHGLERCGRELLAALAAPAGDGEGRG